MRTFQEADEERLHAYLMEKVARTGNYEALADAAMDWLVSEGILRPHGETTLERLIYQARNQAEDGLCEQIAAQLTANGSRITIRSDIGRTNSATMAAIARRR